MPAYDRAAPLLEDSGPARPKKGPALPSKPSLSDQRCFNCGSYTHNLQVQRPPGMLALWVVLVKLAWRQAA